MQIKLYYPQHIVLKGQHIYYYHDQSHGVVLTRSQFNNLNDILYSPLKFMAYPLGGGSCLMQFNGEMRLQTQTGFFTFYRKSWQVYKRWAHRRIRLILRHGGRARGESDANHEVSARYKSRRITSQTGRQAPHWSPRNAHTPHILRKKHANLPQRDCSNPRRRHGRCRQCYVPRIRTSNSPTSSSNDSIEPRDDCTIEEEAMSVNDSGE